MKKLKLAEKEALKELLLELHTAYTSNPHHRLMQYQINEKGQVRWYMGTITTSKPIPKKLGDLLRDLVLFRTSDQNQVGKTFYQINHTLLKQAMEPGWVDGLHTVVPPEQVDVRVPDQTLIPVTETPSVTQLSPDEIQILALLRATQPHISIDEIKDMLCDLIVKKMTVLEELSKLL